MGACTCFAAWLEPRSIDHDHVDLVFLKRSVMPKTYESIERPPGGQMPFRIRTIPRFKTERILFGEEVKSPEEGDGHAKEGDVEIPGYEERRIRHR